jgi:RNA polymerase sigma factor (sigma-70 family)
MATAQLDTILEHVHRLTAQHSGCSWTDRQLVDGFAARRDEASFAALVARHGSMVLRVCRRVLQHEQDAEDAFQATFLVLARHIGSICKRETVANWLYGVAYRTAMKARRSAARRRNHEAHLRERGAPAASPRWEEVQSVLDEEIQGLPDRYRSAFVLCILEGKSRPEVAAEMGVKEGTVWSRLTRARQLLQRRLASRGLELAAVPAALTIAASASRASVPASLAQATVRFALSVAVGAPAAGKVPLHIAALAEGVTGAMFLTKTKIVTAILLVATALIAGLGALAQQTEPPKAEVKGPPPQVVAVLDGVPRPPEDDKGPFRYAGRVLTPDGKPVLGAKLYLLYATSRPLSVLATSDDKGEFHFALGRDDFDLAHDATPWEHAEVIAVAEGHGIGLAPPSRGKSAPRADLTVRLAQDDVPLRGRIVDLQGKPIAGATVRVRGVIAPIKEDLSAFVKALSDKQELFPSVHEHAFGPLEGLGANNLGTLFPRASTDADGLFQFQGIGRERLVHLRIEGPTIITQNVFAMTRPGRTLQLPGYRRYLPDTDLFTIYGNGLEHVAAPCRPIVGVVRDKDTGKSIPGAIVTSYKRAGSHISAVTDLRAVADGEGRYRLMGMPKGEGNVIRAGGPDTEPYLMSVQEVPDTPGVGPLTANFALKRGVWLTGRVLDQMTRAPLHAQVEYVVFEDNPHRKEALGLDVDIYLQTNGRDGKFRTVALPGRGILAARAWNDQYRFGVGADSIKGLEPNGHFPTRPHMLFAQGFNRLVEIKPAVDAKEVTYELLLDPGRTVKGKVLGPDGKPLSGVRVSGLRIYGGHGQWEYNPLPTADFLVMGVDREQTRLLQFTHAEKKLAGHFVLKGDDKGPVEVKLVAAGTLTGRLVTPDGVPVSEGKLASLRGPIGEPDKAIESPTVGELAGEISPGKDGKFRIEGVIPGLTYHLGLIRGMYLHRLGGSAAGKVSVKPGESKDLGDVVVIPIE